MAKVFLICGKICCGKSTYARRLQAENNAVLLSVDEIMLAVFGLYAGEKHDEYTERIRKYLFEKSVEIIESGINWTKAGRAYARDFYAERNIEYEFHYIDITDEEWETRIFNRNNSVAAGETIAYFIDDNLAAKFADLFEPPSADEIDIWVRMK